MIDKMAPTQEIQQTDSKEELVKAKISLHNARFSVEIQEAIVKKLEEMSR